MTLKTRTQTEVVDTTGGDDFPPDEPPEGGVPYPRVGLPVHRHRPHRHTASSIHAHRPHSHHPPVNIHRPSTALTTIAPTMSTALTTLPPTTTPQTTVAEDLNQMRQTPTQYRITDEPVFNQSIEGVFLHTRPTDDYFSPDAVRARHQMNGREQHPKGYNYLGANTEFEARQIGENGDFYRQMMINAGLPPVGTYPFNKPINAVDECAFEHDRVFTSESTTVAEARAADRKFLRCLSDAKMNQSLRALAMNQVADMAIRFKLIGEDMGVIPKGSYSSAEQSQRGLPDMIPISEMFLLDDDVYRKFKFDLLRAWDYQGRNEDNLRDFFSDALEGKYGGDRAGNPIQEYAKQIQRYVDNLRDRITVSYKPIVTQLVRLLVVNNIGQPEIRQYLLDLLEKYKETGLSSKHRDDERRLSRDMERAIRHAPEPAEPKKRVEVDFKPLNPLASQPTKEAIRVKDHINQTFAPTNKPDVVTPLDEERMTAHSGHDTLIVTNTITFLLSLIFQIPAVFRQVIEPLRLVARQAQISTYSTLGVATSVKLFYPLLANFKGDLSSFVPPRYRATFRAISLFFSAARPIFGGGLGREQFQTEIENIISAGNFFSSDDTTVGFLGEVISRTMLVPFGKRLIDMLPSMFDLIKSEEFTYENFLDDEQVQLLQQQLAEYFSEGVLQRARSTDEYMQLFDRTILSKLKDTFLAETPKSRLRTFLVFFGSLRDIGFRIRGDNTEKYQQLQTLITDSSIKSYEELSKMSWGQLKTYFRTKIVDGRTLYNIIADFNDGTPYESFEYANLQNTFTDRSGVYGQPFKRLMEQLFNL